METYQKRLMGHACFVLFIGLFAGFMLAFGLLGGIEIFPGTIVPMPYYGTTEGWVRAHAGGIANGLMMLIFALVLPYAELTDKLTNRAVKIFIFMGWANTVFYWFGNAAGSRALSIGDNPMGASNFFGAVGYIGAIIAAVLTLYIVFVIGRAFLADKS